VQGPPRSILQLNRDAEAALSSTAPALPHHQLRERLFIRAPEVVTNRNYDYLCRGMLLSLMEVTTEQRADLRRSGCLARVPLVTFRR
jgi:hypothetical protein